MSKVWVGFKENVETTYILCQDQVGLEVSVGVLTFADPELFVRSSF